MCARDEAETVLRKAMDLSSEKSGARAQLAELQTSMEQHEEAHENARLAIVENPKHPTTQRAFRKLSFDQVESLISVLPPISLWCVRRPNDQSLLSFTVDAWIAFANAATSRDALLLIDVQPNEVKLAFDAVRDTLLAHANKHHLHRIALERRAPVYKLLARIDDSKTSPAG